MAIVAVCEHFGWDYFTYLKQPSSFLYLAHRKLNIDAEKQKKEEDKAKQASRR